ncbi:piggyBac transposable element-derived protein 4 [Trichonephila clavipes]|nr:piggyBac transposable element-derived protein 4 [Trichonephila clavipes]
MIKGTTGQHGFFRPTREASKTDHTEFFPDGHGYELVSSVRALVPQKFSVEEELMHVKHVEVISPHVGVMWKFGRGVISSDSSSESESDDDCLDSARDWCQIDVTSPLPSHPKFPFTGNPGIKVCIGDSGDPFEYFNLFLDDEMFSFIVEETNRYAESFFENAELTSGSRALKWKNTNKEYMKRFITLLLLQGVVQKPVEQWFWSKRPILSTPFFGKVMGEVRYGILMKFLHFANNDESSSDLDHNMKLKK